MSDIDFDELDKAVNSLMTNVDTAKRNEALDDPEDTVVTLDTTEPVAGGEPVSAPEAVSASTIPASALARTASTSPALAVKRRGQFMDVMHPSSDMKAAKPVKRQGATIAPPAASAIVPEPSNEPTSNAPTPDSGAIEADAPEAPSEQSPLTSPFLPDAKPEKRPLGVASDAGVVSTIDIATELNNELATDAKSEQVELPPEPPALPEELHTDIMAVEATDTTAAEPTELSETPDELTEQEAMEEATGADANFFADVACVALNHLPPRYVRFDVDMSFFLSPQEMDEMADKVAHAVNQALSYVDSRTSSQNQNPPADVLAQ